MAASIHIAAVWAAQLLDELLEEVMEIVGAGLDDTLPYEIYDLKGPCRSVYGMDDDLDETLPWGE